MRTRRLLLTGSGLTAATLTALVVLAARGQDRPPGDVKYYQGKVTQGKSNNYSGTYVPPAGQAKGGAVPTITYPATTPPAAAKPRFTQPVVAGPDGVRTAGGFEPVSATPPAPPAPAPMSPRTTTPLPPPGLPPVAPPPALPHTPADPGMPPVGTDGTPLPPPSVSVDPPGLPDPKPLNPTPPPVAPAPESAPPTFPALPTVTPTTTTPMAKPAGQDQPRGPVVPDGTPLPSRATPSLTVDLVAPENVGVGQALVYELVVRNVGTSPAMNVRVEDELPARAAFVGSEPAAETTGDRLAWSLGTMEAGIEKRIKVTVRPGEEGDLRTRAVVTFAAAVEARIKATRPKIGVAMTGPETVRVGEKVQFRITLTNTGTGPAGRVVLQAKFGDGLSHPQGQVIEAELANLPAGQTKTLNLEAMAAKGGPQVCTLTVTADGNPPEVTKAGVTLVEPMLVAKQTGPGKCLVKAEPVYTIELSNPGTAATDPVTVWATLPAGLEFVSATDGGAFAEGSRSVGWRLAGLAAGTTKTVSLKVRAAAPGDGVIRTTAQAAPAEVTPAGGVPAAAQAGKVLESRAETPVKAEGVPALRFDVADIEDPVEVGKEAVYEIRVVNQGTGPCTNVQIVADVAEGTTVTGVTGPTNGRQAGQQLVFEVMPTFGVKAEAVYRVRVKGSVAGDHRFRVRLVCDQIRTPVVKEENTRFYSQ